jgi:hypothetical protein
MGFLNGSGREHRVGEVIDLVKLAGEDGVIESHHFENCQVKGPAVLVMQGDFSLVENEFEGDPDAYLWEIPEHRTRVIGAILVKDTTFERCTFAKVGLAGRPDFIERVRHDVEAHAANLA